MHSRQVVDVDAERLVVSYLVTSDADVEGALSVVDGLTEEHFSDRALRDAFAVIRLMVSEGVALSSVTIGETLRSSGYAAPTGGDLLRLSLEVPASRQTAEAAKNQLVEVARWRMLTEVCEHLLGARRRGADFRQLVSQAMIDFDALLADEPRGGTLNLGEVMIQRVAELAAANGKPVRRVLTGFRPVDKLTGGFGDSDLVVLAAATGGGKSTFAGNVFAQMADAGHTVLVASAEMSTWELGDRVLSRCTYVPLQALRDNRLDAEQRRTLEMASKFDAWQRVHVIERDEALTVQRVGQVARFLKRQKGLSLIVVDYLQLIAAGAGGERFKTREAEVAAVVRGLKNLAMDLAVPVLALSQFNRDAAKSGEEPELHHLKESGEIEQAANMVLFLWQSKDDPEDIRRLVCKKHRSGAINKAVPLRWSAKHLDFSEVG